MKKKNEYETTHIMLGIQIVLLLILVIQVGSFSSRMGSMQMMQGNNNMPTQQARPAAPTPSQPSPAVDMAKLVDDDPVKGDKNAPVTIVEFSDFECPFCKRFYTQTLSQIEEKYVKTGKVKFVYRDFPLSFHPNAQKAAEAGECADEQGKFWEMHDALFEKGVSGGVDSFKQFAADLNLNTGKFNECLDSGKYASEVRKDMQDGQAAGVTGTPGFLINGQKLVGAQPYNVFEQVIEASLR